MTVYINGTTGLSGVDGSAATPALQGSDSNTGISFGTDTVTINTGGVARVTTDSSGNVGIGTGSPNQRLSVNTSGASSYAHFTNSTTGNASGFVGTIVGNDNGEGLVWNAYNAALKFGTNNTERMRLDSSGNLLVGTASTYSAGVAMVEIKSGGPAQVALRAYTPTASTGNAIQIWHSDVGGTAAEKYFVLANGTATSSDARLKENIVDVGSCLDVLQAVRVRNYTWKGQDGSDVDVGVVAQELESVLPDLVWENPTPADGQVAYKAVRYDKFVPMLIKAIQEQQAMIETLTQRIAALEGAAA